MPAQLDDTYAFQERPLVLGYSFGIFREAPKKPRRQAGSKDKWVNSGGHKGSTVGPPPGDSNAPPRLRCQYGKITCVSGEVLRYFEYTLLPDGNPGVRPDQLQRHVFQVRLPHDKHRRRTAKDDSSRAGRSAPRAAAPAIGHQDYASSAAAPPVQHQHQHQHQQQQQQQQQRQPMRDDEPLMETMRLAEQQALSPNNVRVLADNARQLPQRPTQLHRREHGVIFFELQDVRRRSAADGTDLWRVDSPKPTAVFKDARLHQCIEQRTGTVLRGGAVLAAFHQFALLKTVDTQSQPNFFGHIYHVLPQLPEPSAAPAVELQPRKSHKATTGAASSGKSSSKRKRTLASFAPKMLGAPVRVRDDISGSEALGSPLLTLDFEGSADDHAGDFEMQDLTYMSFTSDGDEVGSVSTGSEGLKLTTTAGDFAEWHELSDQAEELEEGDVVGINHGKVSRQTASAAMVGVVTHRAAVVGSRSRWGGSKARKGAEIAYCGRVPVRVRGPVSEGDVLVSSGLENGLAAVISNSAYGDTADCDLVCSAAERQVPKLRVGVAMRACDQPDDAVSLVEIAVTGPSMSSMQQRGTAAIRLKAAASTIRMAVFITLFVVLISTAAVWLAVRDFSGNNSHSNEVPKPTPSDFGDDELYPQVASTPGLACGGDRAAGLETSPCYQYTPPDGLPGTAGVFKPVASYMCDRGILSWQREPMKKAVEPMMKAVACWELHYGNFTYVSSDDAVYEKLQLAQVRMQGKTEESVNAQPSLVGKDEGPFRCEDAQPDGWAGACPPSGQFDCEDLVAPPGEEANAAVACSTSQLEDYGAQPAEQGGSIKLFWPMDAVVPLGSNIYISELCPETCAIYSTAAGRRRSLDTLADSGGGTDNAEDNATAVPTNDTDTPDDVWSTGGIGDLILNFANVPSQDQGQGQGQDKDDYTHEGGGTTSGGITGSNSHLTFWLGGVPKDSPGVLRPAGWTQKWSGGDGRGVGDGSTVVAPELLSGRPWLCMEDVYVNVSTSGSSNDYINRFEPSVLSWEEGACSCRGCSYQHRVSCLAPLLTAFHWTQLARRNSKMKRVVLCRAVPCGPSTLARPSVALHCRHLRIPLGHMRS
eukprot:COSAG06_NODE_2921_length_6087_cov_38.764863_3_plen_1098_part_00